MPKEYDAETKAKAVRLVRDHRQDYASEYEAIRTVAGRLGMNPETLRKWLRQAAVDAGQAEGTTTAAAREIRELKRKNAELELRLHSRKHHPSAGGPARSGLAAEPGHRHRRRR